VHERGLDVNAPIPGHVLLDRIEDLAGDVGRLRRRVEPESSAAHLVDRLAGSVETIDAMVHASAGELYREFFAISGDHELALEEALATVDTRARRVRGLLGVGRPA
jgi:hypothetical protein